jgi:hypothetical protein
VSNHQLSPRATLFFGVLGIVNILSMSVIAAFGLPGESALSNEVLVGVIILLAILGHWAIHGLSAEARKRRERKESAWSGPWLERAWLGLLIVALYRVTMHLVNRLD